MQEDTKFKIEGEIEGHSSGSDNTLKRRGKNYKPALLFFIVLSVLLLAASGFLGWRLIRSGADQKQHSQVQDQIKTLSDSLQTSQKQSDSLLNNNQSLREKIARLQEFTDEQDGVFFEVQIGNFKDFNLDAYLQEMAHLRQEKVDGTNKFLLGKFRSYKKALLFENDLKRMGLSDVFIKGRIDGQLTSKEEALDYLRNNPR